MERNIFEIHPKVAKMLKNKINMVCFFARIKLNEKRINKQILVLPFLRHIKYSTTDK